MQELESVLESLPLIAYTMTPEGSIDYVNENWFQYSVDPRQFPASHPNDNFCEEFKQHLANGLEFTREVRLQELTTLDYKYHLLRVIPIRQGGQLIRWVGTYTDIHLQKLNEGVLEQQVTLRTKELVIKNAELEQSNHELQQFSWVVSHDLKEPLRKINLFNDMVKEVYLKENHEAVSYLDRSIKASARMTSLINDLLAYSQLTVPAPFQPTDLNVLLEDLLSDFDEIISRTKAKVFIGKIPIIDTIPGRIRQVFQNLISNALKFARSETPPSI